ncbi:hypothetical protein POL68_04685 [Stigmatella sp. ncwal1]|uniref:Lipoprotein n=1 Tax=Stigmatella ashevillensis TaxID=2995309 RepID=A0ABT5D3Q6_9BACT|nr:hypothetical protein [Stigmatella ashevillena]MDC0707758.1 hypothetical protein [Stigmatella ashevillena]
MFSKQGVMSKRWGFAAMVFVATGCGGMPEEELAAEQETPLRAESALVGNGYTAASWGTTTDTTGFTLDSSTDRTCFLSGVAGNLSRGEEMALGEESVAAVLYRSPGNYWLVGHGGATANQVNDKVWYNNPVMAQATCYLTATNVKNATWISDGTVSAPVKIADLDPNDRRQCFLSGLLGVDGAWNNNSRYARVTKKADGWYVESNMVLNYPRARVMGRCVDFPAGTVLSTKTVTAETGTTVTEALTTGTGVKACALTGIQGAFNQNNWTDGALMNFPSTVGGNWTATVTGGKTAHYACAR